MLVPVGLHDDGHFDVKEVNSQELIPEDTKSSVNGWHIIQFSGGKDSPTKFHLNLVWLNNSKIIHKQDEDSVPLLKLRTDVNRITPKAAGVLEKLPAWCSLFGKSTGPYTLAFVSGLPIEF
ncbi:hypothetical protein IHE45_14G002200 [Dioscorea alata]|uniref:Uncharacterized protein n=2 Tax=Dioscorea alata TaxID=55571 RepID=A0ACB7UPP8_DIOAL|nr:hypothetical protein IHE45_14G002200 [Dioscorea alata]KAH7662653.1 hypothetical protein IHE45_14G002200 [Dioscorea alata]